MTPTPTASPLTGPTSNGQHVSQLRAGDRLTVEEFERRYFAMPHVTKAELINGVVYMPSPVSLDDHGAPHFDLITWLGVYRAMTPGVEGADNATLRLWHGANRPQPDGLLRILPEFGGQSGTDADGYLTGAPELAAEVAASSVNYDLHDKLDAYRINGVREYLVWRVEDMAIDCFILRNGQYDRLTPDADGIYRSESFPGLWLDTAALTRRDVAQVLQTLQQGLASPEHAAFVVHMQARAPKP